MNKLSLKRTSIPLYVQLEQIIKSKIIMGELSPGAKIPSEKEFCETYGVSSITARQAILNLVKEDLLYRHQGKGTFVREGTADVKNIMTLKVKGDIEDVVPENLGRQNVQVLGMDFISSPTRILEILNLEEGQEVMQVRRKRSDNGAPVSYIKNYLSADIGRKISKMDLQRFPMLDILRNKLGIPLKTGVQFIEAVSADYEIATALNISISAPVLYLETTLFAEGKKPVEFVQTFYRSDRYKFTLNIGLEDKKGDGLCR